MMGLAAQGEFSTMKICLIGPPTLPEFGVLATVKELRETLADAPLGILSLAAVLDGTGIKSEVLSPNQSYYDYLDSPLRRSEVSTSVNSWCSKLHHRSQRYLVSALSA